MCNFPLTDTGTVIIHLKRGIKNPTQNYKPDIYLGQNYFPEKMSCCDNCNLLRMGLFKRIVDRSFAVGYFSSSFCSIPRHEKYLFQELNSQIVCFDMLKSSKIC